MSENWTTSTEEPAIPPEDLPYLPVDVVPPAASIDTEPEDESHLIPTDGEITEEDASLTLNGYQLSFSEWVRFRIFGEDIPAQKNRQLSELMNAIRRHPDAAVNYVLRGELYMQAREYDAAREDFRQALSLSAAQYETSAWGVLAQSLRDRAIQGLRLLGEQPHVE